VDQADLPGTVEHPNWRRKLPRARALEHAPGVASSATSRLSVFPSRAAATYRLHCAGLSLTPPVCLSLEARHSHVYASPFLNARPGSTHGYDVVDHNQVNPEIGTEEELKKLIRALKEHGMGLVVDLVPNHMGVLHADNPWWLDVLEKGPGSRYARFFDIDWSPGKLLLPVLGKHYGEALEELKVERKGSKWYVRYVDHRFPLRQKNLKPPKDSLALHRLLEKQYYRLAYWRVASDEINYRRFFEITDLAGLRTEDPDVFAATHAFVARLAQRGGIDGLRSTIRRPRRSEEYFERSRGFPAALDRGGEDPRRAREAPGDWPVHGEPATASPTCSGSSRRRGRVALRPDLPALHRRAAHVRRDRAAEPHPHHGDDALRRALHAVQLACAHRRGQPLHARLHRQCAAQDAPRDRRTVSRIPYLRLGARRVENDRGHRLGGRRRNTPRAADPSVFDFVRSVLLLEIAPSEKRRKEMLRFAMRFQQFTAPVVAKGIEDTAFYRYSRLIALNEVGGNASRFGLSLVEFHAAAEERARRWPATMLGSSTRHQALRGRARASVCCPSSSGWRMTLRRWA
jgi:(1->4)-alpha-D-glucan 1-alpha-D-glucosylmutase